MVNLKINIIISPCIYHIYKYEKKWRVQPHLIFDLTTFDTVCSENHCTATTLFMKCFQSYLCSMRFIYIFDIWCVQKKNNFLFSCDYSTLYILHKWIWMWIFSVECLNTNNNSSNCYNNGPSHLISSLVAQQWIDSEESIKGHSVHIFYLSLNSWK